MTAETRIGTLDFPDHTKGDTFQELDISITGLGLLTNPVVRMDIRNGRTLTVRYDTSTNGGIEIITNTADLFKIRITKKVIDLPDGVYSQSIKITADTEEIDTYLSGTWTFVKEPTSHDD